MTASNERKRARMESGLPDTLSAGLYNLVIGGCILYGFLVNALVVAFLSPLIWEMNYLVFLIVYFVLAISGSVIAVRSQSPAISFLGYNMVVLPIGGVLSLVLPFEAMSSILAAIVVTGLVVAIMMILSTTFPMLFARLGWTLLISLGVSLLAETVAFFLGYGGNIFNWIFVVLFSLYIGYDWSRAQLYPKTLDNAVDSAMDLYLDIINLFLRLLRIFSRSRR